MTSLADYHPRSGLPKTVQAVRRRLAGYFDWWFGELANCLPQTWRSRLLGPFRMIEVDLGAGRLHVETVDRRGTQATMRNIPSDWAGAADTAADIRATGSHLDRTRLRVIAPASHVIRRVLRLPKASDRDMRCLIGNEIERLTPLRRDDVVFCFELGERYAQSGLVSVETYIAAASDIDQLQVFFGAAPIYVRGTSGRLLKIQEAAKESHRKARLSLGWGVAAVAAVLLCAALLGGLFLKYQSIDEATAHLREILPRAQKIEATQSAYNKGVGDVRAILKQKSVPLSQTLHAITEILPDDAWISELRLDEAGIRIVGRAPSAAVIMELFERSEKFVGPKWQSPITKIANSDQERFDLVVRMR